MYIGGGYISQESMNISSHVYTILQCVYMYMDLWLVMLIIVSITSQVRCNINPLSSPSLPVPQFRCRLQDHDQ